MSWPLWLLVRPVIRVRRGRSPPARMPDPIWYFAYGSNMNERLFRERRHMVWREARTGFIRDYAWPSPLPAACARVSRHRRT